MNKHLTRASLILAGLLHISPIVNRVAQTSPALLRSPIAIVMTWAIRVAAIAGAYHTVSAASAVLVSATSVSGTVGTRLSYQIRISDGENRTPESWRINGQLFSASGSTTVGMPPGLSLSLATGIISGTPTQAGSFPTTITAYELTSGGGGSTTFTITFNIASLSLPTTITSQPVATNLHIGEPLTLIVGASGTAPISYKWQKDLIDITGATSATYSVTNVDSLAAGSYRAVVTGGGGSATSNPALVTVTPLAISAPVFTTPSMTVTLQTIVGRHYVVQAATTLNPLTWIQVGDTNATAGQTQFVDPTPVTTERYWRYYPSP